MTVDRKECDPGRLESTWGPGNKEGFFKEVVGHLSPVKETSQRDRCKLSGPLRGRGWQASVLASSRGRHPHLEFSGTAEGTQKCSAVFGRADVLTVVQDGCVVHMNGI